jgi:HAD superfamily hydrolase (TIGR01509 family)
VSPPWPRAAVFDLDGLLVDTRACWRSAVGDGAGAGEDLPAGASVAQAARRLGVPPAQVERRLLAEVRGIEPRPLPGVLALLELLGERIPLAVASNSPRSVVAHLLERLEVADRFRAVVTADDVPRGKPAPDVYVEACRLLGEDPSEAVAFEDSSIGARSARAAGAVVIGVPADGGLLPEADLVVRRLDDPALLSFLDALNGARPPERERHRRSV